MDEISKTKMLPALFLQYHPNNDMYFATSKLLLETSNPNLPDLEVLFYSAENVEIVKKMVVIQVFQKSNKQFHIDKPKTEAIRHWMEYVFNVHGLHQRFNITDQIRRLNQMVCDIVVPKIIVQSQQHIGYLKDKFAPRELLDLPKNVSQRRGAKTMPSTFNPL